MALKIDSAVRRETAYIATVTVILSAMMQAVFLLIGKWDLTVLFGNILSAVGAVLNFFLMGLTVQRAVTKDEKNAKNTMKLSQMLRFLMLIGFALVGVLLNCFDTVASLLPLFFPRIAITLRPFFGNQTVAKDGESDD